jgi:hypothetical protein
MSTGSLGRATHGASILHRVNAMLVLNFTGHLGKWAIAGQGAKWHMGTGRLRTGRERERCSSFAAGALVWSKKDNKRRH